MPLEFAENELTSPRRLLGSGSCRTVLARLYKGYLEESGECSARDLEHGKGLGESLKLRILAEVAGDGGSGWARRGGVRVVTLY